MTLHFLSPPLFLKTFHWVCYYSCLDIFPLWLPSIQHPPFCQAIPHHCSCPWVMRISSLATPFPILYFTSPWLFCNYLFVLLNRLTSYSFPYTPLPYGNHQYPLCIQDSVSVLVCLVSIVNRFVFFAILLFTVLIFFFLNKSL